jgi:hypothetical protein
MKRNRESVIRDFILGLKKRFPWLMERHRDPARRSKSLSTSTRGRLRRLRPTKHIGD